MAKRRRAPQPQPTPRRAVGRTRPIATVAPSERRISSTALIIGLVAVTAIVVVGFGLFSSSGSPYTCAAQVQPQAGATVDNPIVTPDEGRAHVQVGSTTPYALCPPGSGPHYQAGGIAPLPPAFYDATSSVGPGNWVHNLEHGYVVALYRCPDGQCPSDDVLSDLREFVLKGPATETATRCGYPSKVLAARFDDMATPFALVAWNKVLLLDAFDAQTGLDFARRWIEQPELPERGSC